MFKFIFKFFRYNQIIKVRYRIKHLSFSIVQKILTLERAHLIDIGIQEHEKIRKKNIG